MQVRQCRAAIAKLLECIIGADSVDEAIKRLGQVDGSMSGGRSTQNHKYFEKAVQRYLKSEGKDILLIGVLIRDTPPNERDLKSRALSLAKKLTAPTRIELLAWYLPTTIDQWPQVLSEEES